MTMTIQQRTLKYYYKKRHEEQLNRWRDIITGVIEMYKQGMTEEEIAEELTKSGYRILLEDTRATEQKLNGTYRKENA